MAILSREDLLNRVRGILGEDNTTDDAIKLIEDVTDTYNSLSNEGNEDWKKKYEQNDAEWRKKYTDRFFNKSGEEPDTTSNDNNDNGEPEKKPLTYENLFKEEEK